jgi:hypothetical protein
MKRRDFIQLSAITGIGLGLSTKLYGNESKSNKTGKAAYKAYTPAFSFNNDGSFNIRNNHIELKNCLPAMGDKPINPNHFRINQDNNGNAQISYTLEQGEVTLVFRTGKDHLSITPALSGFDQAPDYFYTVFTNTISNSNRTYKQDIGFTNSSSVIRLADLDENRIVESYLITGFIAENDETLTVSADKSGEFLFKNVFKGLGNSNVEYKAGFYTENKKLEKSTQVLPGVVFMGGDKPFLAFTNQAGFIKRAEGIGVVRNPQNNWHTFNTGLTGAAFYAALEEASDVPVNNAPKIVYIDDDYCYYGDWLTVNNNWSDDLETVATRINSNGFVPGIRIAPYLISSKSQIYSKHNDWVMRLSDGSPLKLSQPGSEELYLVDFSNEDVVAYIRQNIAGLKEWGFRNFKIDLLGWDIEGAIKQSGYQTNQMAYSSARKFLEIIRSEIGEGGYMLYCNGPLQLAVGLVNGVGFAMSKISKSSSIQINTEAYFSQYFNNILWQNHINTVDSASSGNGFGSFLGTTKDFTLGENIQRKDTINNDKPIRAYLPSWPDNDKYITALKFNGDRKSLSLMLINNTEQETNKLVSVKSIIGSSAHVYICDYYKGTKNDMGIMDGLEVNLESGQSNTYYLEPDVLPSSLYSLG